MTAIEREAEDLLRRLRAVYCRHRGMTYATYDSLVAQEGLNFSELYELMQVLFTEVQNMGLYEFLFATAVGEREKTRGRLEEIETSLRRIGAMGALSPELCRRYAPTIEQLTAEGNLLRRQLG